jgi:hypothetical protein
VAKVLKEEWRIIIGRLEEAQDFFVADRVVLQLKIKKSQI